MLASGPSMASSPSVPKAREFARKGPSVPSEMVGIAEGPITEAGAIGNKSAAAGGGGGGGAGAIGNKSAAAGGGGGGGGAEAVTVTALGTAPPVPAADDGPAGAEIIRTMRPSLLEAGKSASGGLEGGGPGGGPPKLSSTSSMSSSESSPP
jgi:hypothetical protein